MSAKLDIFKAVKAAIIKDAPQIRTFGFWNNQFEHEPEEIAFNYPCVFLEFSSIPWTKSQVQAPKNTSRGNVKKQQKGEGMVVVLHIGFAPLKNVDLSFELDLDPVLDCVYFAVEGLNGEFFSPMLRSAEKQDVDHGRVIDWQMDFTFMITQCGQLDDSLREIAANTLSLCLDADLGITPSGGIYQVGIYEPGIYA